MDKKVVDQSKMVPLKKICATMDLDPKVARRVLRDKMDRPNGRWSWTPAQSRRVESILKKYLEARHDGES